MTKKQDEIQARLTQIARYIEDYSVEYGYPPSVRDICNALSIKSTASVQTYLNRLEADGIIKRGKSVSRALEVVGSNRRNLEKDTVTIPLIGEVAAGTPKLAVEMQEDAYPFPSKLFASSGELFMLKVSGDSMIDIGMYDGDLIVVRSQSTAENGQIIVAMISDEVTVKRFYKEDGYVRLHPENRSMRDMIFKSVNVLGIVVGLVRTNV